MPAPLSEKTVAVIKATVPALEAHGFAISHRMYERLFKTSLSVAFSINSTTARAARKRRCWRLPSWPTRAISTISPSWAARSRRITQKHVALNILPEHYPFVADALLAAIGDVLGDAATPEIAAAWTEAYWFLAEILIGREAAVYRELAAQPGGWNGWRDFAVENVVDESSIIRSFTLVPVDGGKVLRHKPGQYLGFALDLPEIVRSAATTPSPAAERSGLSDHRQAGGATRRARGVGFELAARPGAARDCAARSGAGGRLLSGYEIGWSRGPGQRRRRTDAHGKHAGGELPRHSHSGRRGGCMAP